MPVKKNLESRLAGRDMQEAVLAAAVGEGLERRALDGDPRFLDVLAGAGIGYPAFNDASGAGLRERRGGAAPGEHQNQRRDANEEGFHGARSGVGVPPTRQGCARAQIGRIARAGRALSPLRDNPSIARSF
jgi:hypothetical protein